MCRFPSSPTIRVAAITGSYPGPITCSGGLLVINPATLGSAATHTVGAFNPSHE